MENQNILPPDTASLPKNGRAKAVNLSSGTTLFWRIFLPIFGTVLTTTFTIAFLLTDVEDMGLPFPALWARITIVLLWLGWCYFIWRILWRLKRVDADATHLYVTNYWTTVRYPWADVERIEIQRRWGRRVVHLHLRASGRFGQRISFLPGSSYSTWMREREEGEPRSAN
ncbi:MAG: hypothetical protein ABIQ93_12430 [Saprospiraceae bacterium]